MNNYLSIKEFMRKYNELINSADIKTKIHHYKSSSWDTKDWADFSLSDHNEDDIRVRILAQTYFGEDCISVSYMLSASKVSEEFLEELMFITSPLFDFSYYDQDHIDAVCKFYSLDKKGQEEFKKKIYESDIYDKKFKEALVSLKPLSEINCSKSNNKLDWFNIINYQNVSENFLDKYAENIKLDKCGYELYKYRKFHNGAYFELDHANVQGYSSKNKNYNNY